MFKRILNLFFLVSLVMFSSGCLALLAGAGGTALWQAGKVISEETTSIARGVTATEAAFKAKKITLTEKVVKSEVTQIRGEDQYNNKVAVDIFYKGPKNIRIEIRYGLGEEIPARDILSEIKRRL